MSGDVCADNGITFSEAFSELTLFQSTSKGVQKSLLHLYLIFNAN